MASDAVLVQGTAIRISIDEATPDLLTQPVQSEVLDCISREVAYEGGTSDEVAVDTFCSPSKEYRLGLSDGGTFTVNGFWNQFHPAHQLIRTAAADKKQRLIEVQFSDGTVFRALAMVSQRSWSAGIGGVIGATYSFRITGETYESAEPLVWASASTFLQAFPAINTLPNAMRLVKLRSDYLEFAVYTAMDSTGINWARWYFCNRLNVGNSGAARLNRATLAKLYATSVETPNAVNLATGTQAQAPTTSVGTTGSTARVGTWTTSATISGVTDVRYSTVTGDYVEYTVTGVRRIAARGYANSANGGYAVLSVKTGGVELADSFFLTKPGKIVDLRMMIGYSFTPLVEGLNPASTYVVRLTVDATNPASGRIYDGGLVGYSSITFNALGYHGIAYTQALGSPSLNTSAVLVPGSIAVYEVTDATKVVWRRMSSPAGGQVSFKVYNSVGTEIGVYANTTNDTYGASSILGDIEVATGLPKGTYYLHVKLLNTKNASSTSYRMYDYGAIGVDTTAAGNPATGTFDDLGVLPNQTSPAAITLQGTGNVEGAIKLRKPADAVGVNEDFVGGTHGHEGAPSSVVFKVDGATVDYAGAAAGVTWNGASLSWSYNTVLQFLTGESVANATYEQTLDRNGFWHAFTRTFTASAMVSEDYCLMVQAPKPGAAEGGFGGGMETVAVKPGSDVILAQADNESSIGTTSDATEAVIYNAGAMVHCALLNLPEIQAQFSAFTQSSAPRSFVQDRADGFVKFYVRANRFASGGSLVSPGNTYTARRMMRVALR